MKNTRIVATIKLKRSVTDIQSFCIFIGTFSYREKSCLVILLIIGKSLKINLSDTILSLYLAIVPWIKDSWESLFDSKKVA